MHDPDGREKYFGIFDSEENLNSSQSLYDLTPGVYELVILGQFTSSKESIYNLNLEVDGINIIENSIAEKKSVSLVNYFDEEKSIKAKGNLLGYQKNYNVKISGNNVHKIPFELKNGESKKEFEIKLSKEDFNKVTDFALMIYDETGKAVDVNGLSYSFGLSSVTKQNNENEKVEKYEFVLIPGFANVDAELEVNICEKTYFAENEKIVMKDQNLNLYPFTEIKLSTNFEEPKITKPIGTKYFVELVFNSANTNEIEFKKVITINSKE